MNVTTGEETNVTTNVTGTGNVTGEATTEATTVPATTTPATPLVYAPLLAPLSFPPLAEEEPLTHSFFDAVIVQFPEPEFDTIRAQPPEGYRRFTSRRGRTGTAGPASSRSDSQ
jgi:hypothetical protein